MQILKKDILVKDYDCSYNKNNYNYKRPLFNLYIQAQNQCNAKCDFCNPGNINNNFSYEKLDYIIKYLNKQNLLARCSITGGEPLLDIEKITKITDVIKRNNIKSALNTNGYNLIKLKYFIDIIDDIFISKHHYKNVENDDIMKIHTPNLFDLSSINKKGNITINCVLQKNYIDSYEKVISFLEYLGQTNINKIKFISLYPLTEEAINKNINILDIFEKVKKYTNSGMLFDKNICQCFEFLYVTKTGKVITVNIRYNKTEKMPCCRQLVFNGEYLYDGFEKNNILY